MTAQSTNHPSGMKELPQQRLIRKYFDFEGAGGPVETISSLLNQCLAPRRLSRAEIQEIVFSCTELMTFLTHLSDSYYLSQEKGGHK